MALLLTALLLVLASARLNPDLYMTPQMGFNTGNHFGLDINEERSSRKLQIQSSYLVKMFSVTFMPTSMTGILYKIEVKTAMSFQTPTSSLTDYVHSKGLKLGIYS